MKEKYCKIPKFRFNKFLESWKRLKYEDVIEVNSGKDYKHLEKGDIPVYGTGGYMLSVSEAITNKDGVGIGRKGTINKPYILKAPYWTVDTLFFCIPKNKYNLYFINAIFERTQWERFDESTGVPSLSKLTINNIQNYFPSFDEQSAIGSLFRTLDDLLASYKDNLANDQSLKATMLSKMFPKAGQTVPEIRLDGFEGEWKLYELKSRAETITKGTTPKDKSWQRGSKNYIKTESINRDTGSLVRTASTSLDEHLGYLKRSILKEDDVLFSIVGTLGVVGIVDKKDLPANTNQQIAIIRLKRDDAIFMLNFLKSPRIKSFIKSDSTIGAQPSLSLWQIEKIKVSLPPSLEEQQAIGTYFSNLDNLINSHQEKISQLETLKKKLLQDMFI